MKFFLLLLPAILLAGCNSLPKVAFSWPESEKDKEIVQLQNDLKNAQAETQKILQEKTDEIVREKTDRISLGSSQVYAAYGTLGADPDPNKYTDAASRALVVAKEALPVPKVEDLLKAVEIQKQLLSEQALEIEKGKKDLAEQSNVILESKNKVAALEKEKEVIALESQKTEEELRLELEAAEEARRIEREELAAELNTKAKAWEKDNSFWAKINPLNGLARTFSSLMFWIILFVVIGGGLKIASIFFPGVNIIQTMIGGIGRTIGSIIGLFTKWIPDALRGMNAVDYKQFEQEKKIADNAVGAVQELKYENPQVYNDQLKSKLQDWFKDTPELVSVVDQKLKDLNLK